MELKKKMNDPGFFPRGKRGALSFFLLLSVLLCHDFFSPVSFNLARAADKTEEEILQETLRQREVKLWQDANAALQAGKDQEAAEFFLRYYKKFPESPRAEEALWKTANLHRELALGHEDADWEKVKELYRSFTIDYPDSPLLADAYFEVANAFYHMHYYRDALTYFGFFSKRFHDSAHANEAVYMKARILMKIGRVKEARGVYSELSQAVDEVDKLRGQAGLAHIDFANKKYHDALAVYLKILQQKPSFYMSDPEVLRNKGLADLRLGNLEEGRKELLHYLNITGDSASRSEILFELAEGYKAGGYEETARKLYTQVAETGEEDDRAVILSRLRLAQETAQEPETQQPAQEKEKVAPATDDKPFQDVLDRQYKDPLSQDARLELARRYWKRQEYDQSYNMGKSYLRYATTEAGKKEIIDIMGRILVKKMEELFRDKKYDAVYQLYQKEYSYVKMYGRGKLLYLAGRALEEMALYKQAGAIYYRALALELTEEEKLDLYIHRARSYMADNDLQSAQRLLKYLRKIYASDPALGEICSLSGHLRELQKRGQDALTFYQIAVESPTFAEKKKQYATDYLRLLFAEDKILEKAGILDVFQKESWLPAREMQEWYGKLAERYRQADKLDKSGSAYLSALADNMPQDNETAQRLHLSFGDILLLLGKKEEALTHFKKAAAGGSSFIKKLAQQRMTQENINRAMSDAEAVLKK
ncbi:MAG: tetratricopeptide repeat protein [Deltaproteobacteria bacterium]|nr:tetratricopeptide repeat protein [Deltaproteobacteria bacterium]